MEDLENACELRRAIWEEEEDYLPEPDWDALAKDEEINKDV